MELKRSVVSRSTSHQNPHAQIRVQLRPHQKQVYDQLQRFNVLLAHRRFGKTVLAIVTLLMKALECRQTMPQVHYYCPTYSQAKRVAWSYLKEFTRPLPGTRYHESELKATLATGAVIQLGSAENPDASRGIYSDFVVLDEPAQMPPEIWTSVLRPALSDRRGGMLMIGTPAGRHGLFYDAWQQADSTPDWWRGLYRADQTGIVDQDELLSNQRSLTKAQYDQEFLCSWDAALKGAYWAEAMDQLDQAGRIGDWEHQPGQQVHVAMDLGVSDATACWFYQVNGNTVTVIDYAEYTNMGLPTIVADWRARPYNYGKVVAPHDVKVRSLSTGQTRLQTLYDLGVDVVVAPALPREDGIEVARSMLPRARFNRAKCAHGIEALRQYRADWEEKRGVLKLQPLHDWTSHAADAWRYLAITGIETLTGSWSNLDYSAMDKARCA
jgi:hypothetical protein